MLTIYMNTLSTRVRSMKRVVITFLPIPAKDTGEDHAMDDAGVASDLLTALRCMNQVSWSMNGRMERIGKNAEQKAPYK